MILEVGRIYRAKELNRTGWNKYIYQPCPSCGIPKITRIMQGKPEFIICVKCSGQRRNLELAYQWKGGKYINKAGYYIIQLARDDFFCSMANSHRRVYEHRYVMAKHMNRCLLPWEQVHHKNGNRADNRLENLELVKPNNHGAYTRMHTEIKRLQKINLMLTYLILKS